MSFSVGIEETRDAADGLAQVVLVGQEHDAEVLVVRVVEAGALDQHHAGGLQQFQESNGAQWGMMMAASLLITLPMIVLFFCLQRLFVQGIATTGLK